MQAEVSPVLPPTVTHLRIAGAAFAAAILLVVTVRIGVQRQLQSRLESFASSSPTMRMNGNLLQRAAFADQGTLPIYGSSELDQPADNRPDVFFRHRPTGFDVFSEGHAGTTCLMLMQKIAAAGSAVRGRKTVVFLSPSWFARPGVTEHTVTANLPTAQLSAWVFNSPLSLSLKEKLARRLRHFPDATKGQPLLTSAVRALSERKWKDRWFFAGLWPLGKMQSELSLDFESETLLWNLCKHPQRFHHDPGAGAATGPTPKLPWKELAARAEAKDRARNDGTAYSVTSLDAGTGLKREVRLHPQTPGSRDGEFTTKLRSAEEWHDLKLMTEVLRDLGVHALFISQPINGKFYDSAGISTQGREFYYKKLANLVHPSGFPLLEYVDHENDKFFFNDSGHPSAKAWIYYDEALDRFYRQAVP